MVDFALSRENMIEGQIRPNKVTDPELLGALGSLPREDFLPLSLQNLAYTDSRISLPQNRVMLSPMVMARLIAAAKVKKTDKVLDIAGAWGYSGAVFSLLAREIFALESNQDYAKEAQRIFDRLNLPPIKVEVGKLSKGLVSAAPFDIIFINGMVDWVPENLFNQLAEGGRLLTICHKGKMVGQATLWLKTHGLLGERTLFEASAPLLEEFSKDQNFVF